MQIATMIRDCGWQVILGGVVLVQFLTICVLRSRVSRLQEYEYWYLNQYEQPKPDPQAQTLRQPLRPLPRRR